MKKVHVIGTGTIGEPIIGLLADNKKSLGIDDVTFYKRTPLSYEVPKVNSLISRGAKLTTDVDKVNKFQKLGNEVSHYHQNAIAEADVVIDCTPAGKENKAYYSQFYGPKVYMAQGSENGFGIPYAWGINDKVIKGERFVQIVSCNTHNICSLIETIYPRRDPSQISGDFVCIRRASDLSQNGGFISSPEVGQHDDNRYGTHHASDATRVFLTKGLNSPTLYSSVMKIPTQYMHTIRFKIENKTMNLTKENVIENFRANPRIAITEKMSSNLVFSFGRDHGFYGRLLTQTVIPTDSVQISRDGSTVTGFCFTPQDGNALLSSVACTMWALHEEDPSEQMMNIFGRWMFQEV